MNRLTADQVRGIWAGVTLSWDELDQFDEASYRANTETLCRAGVHGIYTSGSTGEFYALDWNEFRRMVDIQAEICGQHEMPLQIGCCADDTRKVLRLIEYAASKPEVGAVQVTLPYWMELTDREVLRFFEDICRAFPEMPLVHYNVPRAKRFLLGPDYVRVLQVAPRLIGVKFTFAGAYFAALQTALAMTPDVSYFVGEDLLASAMMLGARGSYSSLVTVNPDFMLTMYDHAEDGRWELALQFQQLAARFGAELEALVEARGEGMIDPVADKGLAIAAGGMVGSHRTRAPYLGWSEETVAAVRQWMGRKFPELLFDARVRRDPAAKKPSPSAIRKPIHRTRVS